MARVTNQNIPSDHIEDGLNPPIDSVDQYKKTLTPGSPIPDAPAGTDRVNYMQHDSRPARRDVSTPGPGPDEAANRQNFKDCLACWRALPKSAAEADPCGDGTNKGHKTGIPWYPHARGATNNTFMKECLDYLQANPGDRFSKCVDQSACTNPRDLAIDFPTLQIQCEEMITLAVDLDAPGCPPYTWTLVGDGEITQEEGNSTSYYAPESNDGCTHEPLIILTDACGQQAEVTLAVSCYTGPDEAYVTFRYESEWWQENCGPWCGYGNGPIYMHYCYADVYSCQGTLLRSGIAFNMATNNANPPQSTGEMTCNTGGGSVYTYHDYGWHTVIALVSNGHVCGCEDPLNQGCGQFDNNAISNAMYPLHAQGTAVPGDGETWDIRSQAMIDAGCCPINPTTEQPL